ncbi:MAG: hypothetical protein ABIU58_06955 [Ramlibacter sp.]
MNAFPKLLITTCALGLALAATAGTSMGGSADSKITNGGTGFIGVTESAGQPRVAEMKMWMTAAQSVSAIPTAAGEASTMVNGNPNGNPDAPAYGSARSSELRAMGNAAATYGPISGASAHNPAWGTPD